MAVSEKEAYDILKKPYIRTKEVAQLVECDIHKASKLLTMFGVRRVHKGVYITADFRKKFELEQYWKQVSRYADK